MSSILSSQGVVLATAMAVSGTVILLAFRLQKSPNSSTTDFPLHISQPLRPPSCIISSDEGKKKEKKKKKKVHFAKDVVDPTGNGDEYRKLHSNEINAKAHCSNKYSNSNTLKKSGEKVEEMPANRVALYNGILRDRVLHRVAYSC